MECRAQQSVEYLTSGVPQGSIVGLLFFNVFINDIVVDINCLLADDIKIYNKIDTMDDCWDLQHALDRMNDWCLSNKLNIGKCNVVTYTNKQKSIQLHYT